jgi:hypothetical protein
VPRGGVRVRRRLDRRPHDARRRRRLGQRSHLGIGPRLTGGSRAVIVRFRDEPSPGFASPGRGKKRLCRRVARAVGEADTLPKPSVSPRAAPTGPIISVMGRSPAQGRPAYVKPSRAAERGTFRKLSEFSVRVGMAGSVGGIVGPRREPAPLGAQLARGNPAIRLPVQLLASNDTYKRRRRPMRCAAGRSGRRVAGWRSGSRFFGGG